MVLDSTNTIKAAQKYFEPFFIGEITLEKNQCKGVKSKYFIQLMFGLWYSKEAYSKCRNSAPKILKIRVMVAEQFMKTLQNCAIAQNSAILEHFHQLLHNRNSDH